MAAASQFDLVIVGGGINGCMLARASARAGLRTALVEKRDFGAGVTSRSTRLIHGGLRYLESFHVGLVRESLRDRERLLREFPGIVEPQSFFLPAYISDSRPSWQLAAGLAMYRVLCLGGSLPPPRRRTPSETLALLPGLDPDGLECGFEYFDCQATYPERLALEAALQAAESGADVRNHARATGFVVSGSRIEGVRIETSSGTDELRCALVVNAAGAWVDRVLGLLPGERAKTLLSLVNGTHIAVPEIPGAPRNAVYREARSDKRPFFIVPWRGLYLIGTTETSFEGDPDRIAPTDRDIEYLIDETNQLFPSARIQPETVLYAYCGSRPLLRSSAGNLQVISRGHEVVDHERTDGILGLLTMAGGKLTTAPTFADETLRHATRKLGVARPRPTAPLQPPSMDGVPPRIARVYGPRAPELLRYLQSSPSLDRPLVEGCETSCGELLFAAEHEKASTLGDILLRRTGMAFDASYRPSWVHEAAEVVGAHLGWDRQRREAALEECLTELSATLRNR